MAKTISTRIKLRYDTWDNWNSTAGQGLVLFAGEMGVVSVPGSSKPDGTQITPPAVMFKVGDGTTTFANLPWGSGLAADVYAWAKKSGITVSTSGSGDFISAISWSNDQLNVTKGSINITATGTGATGVITGISASGKTITYTQESLAGTPSSGSSAGKAITAFTITQDANGKISKITPTWGDISTDNQKITVSDGETTSSWGANDTVKLVFPDFFTITKLTSETGASIALDESVINEWIDGRADNKINALDVASIGGSGQYIQSISETNGKISAVAATMPTSLKNPYALTINGADSYTSAGTSIVYDGSAAATARLLQHSGTLGWASDGTISEFQVGSTYYTAKWKIPTPLSSINTSSDTYVNSTAVANYVAEAISTQTQAYVIDETSTAGANPLFAILNTSSTTSVSFTDDERILTVDEQSINFSGMHIGDVIYTKGANYKDWFLGSNSGGYVFYQIASDKPILTDYVKHSDVSVYNPTLSWGTTSSVLSIGDKLVKVTMPANPDTHYTNTFTIQGAGTNVVSFAQNANKTLNIAAGTNVTVTPDATNGKITISSADTHYTTGLYVGATGAKSNAATTNGNTYLKLFDNDTSRANLKITGTGATTVASDASGNITISSTNSTYNGNLTINAYLDDTLTVTNLVNYTPSSNADLTLNHGNYIKYTKSANSLTVDVNTDSLVTTNSSDHIIMYGGTATDVTWTS